MIDEDALFQAIENAEKAQKMIDSYGGYSAFEKMIETLSAAEEAVRNNNGILQAVARFEEATRNWPNLEAMLSASSAALSAASSPVIRSAMKAASNFYESAGGSSFVEKLIAATELPTIGTADLLARAAKKAVNVPWLTDEAVSAALQVPMPDYTISEDGAVVYEGITYSAKDLQDEVKKEIKDSQKSKKPLREKFEEIKKRYWVLILIFQLFVFLPTTPQIVSFYKDAVDQVVEMHKEASRICFVTRDRAFFREEPLANAKIIKVLLYDTELEIVEDIPRWYKVKYTDSDGNETIGWISKISVELGDLSTP